MDGYSPTWGDEYNRPRGDQAGQLLHVDTSTEVTQTECQAKCESLSAAAYNWMDESGSHGCRCYPAASLTFTPIGAGWTLCTAQEGTFAELEVLEANGTHLRLLTPPCASAVCRGHGNITIHVGAVSTPAGTFKYSEAAMVTGLSTTTMSASGGTVLVITGSNLLFPTTMVPPTVTFGDVQCDVTDVPSSSAVTCTTHKCAVGNRYNINITVPGYGEAEGSLPPVKCVALPEILFVEPSSGTIGSTITIHGIGFQNTSNVMVGSSNYSNCVLEIVTPSTLATEPTIDGVLQPRIEYTFNPHAVNTMGATLAHEALTADDTDSSIPAELRTTDGKAALVLNQGCVDGSQTDPSSYWVAPVILAVLSVAIKSNLAQSLATLVVQSIVRIVS